MNNRYLKNWINAIRLFYGEYTVHNLIFTLIAGYFTLFFPQFSLIYAFWLKVAGYAFVSLVYYGRNRNHLNFYYNLQINPYHLWLTSNLVDFGYSFIGLILLKEWVR